MKLDPADEDRPAKLRPAARTLSFEAAGECLECRRLRETEDRFECQRGSMGIVSVGDPSSRVAQDLNRRFRHMLVIVGRARFSQIFQDPRTFRSRFDISLMRDASQSAEFAESIVRPTTAAQEHRRIWVWIVGTQTLQVEADRAVHRPPKCFSRFHAPIVKPAPR